MKIIKRILSLLSTLCLVGLAITESVYFAIALLVFASMTIGVFLGEIKFNRIPVKQKQGKEIPCTFKDITEKDMDMLFLEEIVSSQKFADLFLTKIGMTGALVVEAEHSKTHPEYGESDMTIIVEQNGKRYGLLIEDKIDAIAMPDQYARYIKRGEYGVANGDYENFSVFMVAPEKYLDEMVEEEYPNQISYEECLEYFEKSQDARSKFRAAQIRMAIDCQKKGYRVIEDKSVSDFWEKYIAYQKEYYSSLRMISKGGAKGANAGWPQYRVNLENVIPKSYIYHKTQQGCVDLSIPNAANKVKELEKYVESVVGDLDKNHLCVCSTGKAAAIRIEVKEMDFKHDFNKYSEVIDECFLAIKKMYEIEGMLDGTVIKKIIES